MKQSSTKKPLKKAKVSTATKRPKQVAKPAPSKRSAKNRSVARRSSRGTVLSLKAFLVLVIAVVLTLLAVYLFRQNQEVNYGVFVCSDDAMATDAHCNDDLVSCNVALDDNCDGKLTETLGDVTTTPVPPAPAGPIFTIYVSTKGNDNNFGLSQSSPIKTLVRAQQIVKTYKPAKDVEIRIGEGTYKNQHVKWTYFIPGHTISFMPVGYTLGNGMKGFKSRPRFTGNINLSNLLLARTDVGQNTGLRFYYLQIDHYLGSALSINGGTTDVKTAHGLLSGVVSSGANGNVFYGLTIQDIGSGPLHGPKPSSISRAPTKIGYGGIVLQNSNNNIIRNNNFNNLTNNYGYGSHIHGLYFSHHVSHNVVSGNYFKQINGNPIKLRDGSNYNEISNNEFRKTGLEAAVFLSHQEGGSGPMRRSAGHGDECSSYGNTVHNNKVGTLYNGNKLPVVDLRNKPGNARYAGLNPACPDLPKGVVRVSTKNNVRL